MKRTASCSCGQLQAEVECEPLRISICHCLACQRRTGSVFGAQARFLRSGVRLEGASSTWERIGDDGGTARFHFCPTCGATVWYEVLADDVDWLAFPVGAFAEPGFPAPQVSVYESRRHAWVVVPPDAEHWD